MSARRPASAAPGPWIVLHLDGEAVRTPAGTSVAAALIAHGRWDFRRDAVTGQPRGPFCGMGVCMECEVTVDGTPGRRACLERVRPGMRIDTGRTAPDREDS
ncbi:(2Fe-2S)-binding protein [Thermobifida halotolerans]|uniref:(2Fe-2S)-binding protein n=1 Tax=Thermobifida halotolerans TaxID=483545 RepID=A0A399G6W9_9ACTN|nr:(2Fe-2S)-binding protein [Thermobifida halotolerans]UOE20364.1 (2Fe-2S)-binding protein [Thermobifida halotolerans]